MTDLGYFVFDLESKVELAIWAILLVVKVFAAGDAATRKGEFFVAADKQNKVFWLVLLSVFAVLHLLLQSPLQILNLIGCVAAFVYLADVRPTLRSMRQY